MFVELMDAPKEILREIALSKEKLYASELARLLDKSQAAAFKNLQPLLENKLIKTELEHKGGKQFLLLTDKGAYYAVSQCGLRYLDVVSNHPYLETVEGARESLNILAEWGLDQFLMFEIADLSVRKDLFDNDGGWLLDVEKYGTAALRYTHYFRAIFIEATMKLADLNKLSNLKARKIWFGLAIKFHVQPKEVDQILVQVRR